MDCVGVLLVDDYADMLNLTNLQLENLHPDFDFYKATSGEEALDYIDSEDLDVIISDFNMPKMNGLELLEKAEEEYGEQNFILYTCNHSIGEKAKENNAVYVEKGDLDNLDYAIEEMLSQVNTHLNNQEPV